MPLDALVELHAECFPNKHWTALDFSELENSGCEIITSENSFIVYRVAADEAEIITIGVRPAARRNGTASALLGILENELQKKNIKKIFLEVAVDNDAALKLYEKNGFTRVGTRPKYYDGIDAVIMEKSMEPCKLFL